MTVSLFRRPSARGRQPGRALALAATLVACGSLAGCAGYRAFHEGQDELARGHDELAVAKLKEATEAAPDDIDYREAYFTRRDALVAEWLHRAEMALRQGDFALAHEAFARALKMDPASPRAAAGLDRVAAEARQWTALDKASTSASEGDVQGAIAGVRAVLSENPDNARAAGMLRQLLRQQADATGRKLGIYPTLRAAYRKPVTMSFSNASLRQVFDSLKAASGLNYVFDRDVRADAPVTLAVTNKPVEDILRLLLATNKLEERILDDDTLLIYPETREKEAEYREKVVRSFFLRHASAAQVADMIRTIAKTHDVFVDDKLNMIMVRDNANVIRLVEKLISNEDVAQPEVELDLEVLEVSKSRLQDLGVTWPSSISASVAGAGGAGQLTWDEARHFNSGLVTLNFNDPLAGAQLRSQVGDAHLLANPRIRVRNKQVADTLIGERVPIFTTTATANVGTSESVNYLDVGLKLEIKPTISLDGDVSMVIALEVSNIIDTITRASGTQAYRLGTRNTSTTLQVHDGETSVLAGLIQKEDRGGNTGLPWLNEIPILGKLFGAAQDSNDSTEIVLLVTPHIVRNIQVPGLGQQEFTSGTEDAMGAAPIQFGTPWQGAPAMSGAPYGLRRPTGAPGQQIPVPPGSQPDAAREPEKPAPPPPSATPPTFVPPPLIPTAPGGIRGQDAK